MRRRIARFVVVFAALVSAAVLVGQSALAGPGEITGSVPAGGGIAAIVWGGGPISALRSAAAAQGCGLSSIWLFAGGSAVGYVMGAPAFVNSSFLGVHPGDIPPGTILFLQCEAAERSPAPAPTNAPAAPSPTPTATPPTRASPVPTASATPAASPTASPAQNYQVVTPISVWVTNAVLAGFTSDAGSPVVPAWTSCSSSRHLGWGLRDGAKVDLIGQGTGPCAGWYVLYDGGSDATFWMPATYLSTQAPAPPSASVIRTCIEGDFTGWTGESVFELCNGDVWVQTSFAYLFHYAYRPNVTIVRSAAGWTMTADGVRGSVAVQKAPSFVRSCIDGQFDGWRGGTTFALCNGQVWQQTDYRISYSYRYRPRVLIYESPFGGYRMKVEGVDDTIGVQRVG